MELSFDEVQEALGRAAREFFEGEAALECTRRCYRGDRSGVLPLWRKAAEHGFIGMLVPAEYGGGGLDLRSVVLALEAAGRFLVPGPLVETAALAVSLLQEAGSAEQKERFLRPLAGGRLLVAASLTGLAEDEGAAHLAAADKGDRWVLSGFQPLVADVDIADYLLVQAGVRGSAGDVALFLVPKGQAGVAAEDRVGLDRSRHFARVVFEEVSVGPDLLLARGPAARQALARALRVATVALCSTMVGAAQAAMEMAVDYANTRQQFGSYIGRFQAIKHKCADMLVLLEGAKTATYYAAWAVGTDQPEAEAAVSLAKQYVSETFTQIATDCIDVHGGIGVTWEHNAHLYLKRARLSEAQLGNPGLHRERLAAALGW